MRLRRGAHPFFLDTANPSRHVPPRVCGKANTTKYLEKFLRPDAKQAANSDEVFSLLRAEKTSRPAVCDPWRDADE
jgi:hypothetical protein